DRLAGHVMNRQYVVPVQFVPRNPVAIPPVADAGTAAGIRERNFGRVLVVFAHENYRQLPDRGHIQPLMERAVVRSAVAEERDSDRAVLQDLRAVTAAARLQDA